MGDLVKIGKPLSVQGFDLDRFKSNETLWLEASKYMEYAQANPIITSQPNFRNGGSINVEKTRPMTLEGLLVFLGITKKQWRQIKNNIEFKMVHETCEYVEMCIDNQLFEMAAIREYDSALIIRKLGLADKKENTSKKLPPIFAAPPIANNTDQSILDKSSNDIQVVDFEDVDD